ncbi:hypothetical protein VOLCADRAFT_96070 [Volvox carteri f. nagariensis]|uniref:NYN domain-containing protein n=1 Tax=Volvox carteri f. nagariensis TaxID=3068 RepID=D8U947_VOLCA|nr:uncharacterized protein VOLCADRAFT_96070 [Volvox carteri f. nagariensis]EFJ43747.1 hypothetical protein VOLCADRAFT_96070 [Volvox carteri f. nagariensis]|eukprot:XP_002955228.1 hypothetical protein VOLCADRAFT_96070 [Volvox carteri f. nagariensis]
MTPQCSHRTLLPLQAQLAAASSRARVRDISSQGPPGQDGPRVALVDGYNVIHACRELHRLARFSLQVVVDARFALNRMAVAYGATYGIRVFVVYDAMGSQSTSNSFERLSSQAVAVFSAASEADTYIGKAAVQWKQRGAQQVMVVSNDRYVQDNAIDGDYVIYPVQLDTWLDQAHRAATAPGRRPGSGGATAAATGLSRSALSSFSAASSANFDGDDDGGGGGDDDAEGHRSSGRRGGRGGVSVGMGDTGREVVPSSWELQRRLARLVKVRDAAMDNDGDDDGDDEAEGEAGHEDLDWKEEEEEHEAMEEGEEEQEVDWLAWSHDVPRFKVRSELVKDEEDEVAGPAAVAEEDGIARLGAVSDGIRMVVGNSGSSSSRSGGIGGSSIDIRGGGDVEQDRTAAAYSDGGGDMADGCGGGTNGEEGGKQAPGILGAFVTQLSPRENDPWQPPQLLLRCHQSRPVPHFYHLQYILRSLLRISLQLLRHPRQRPPYPATILTLTAVAVPVRVLVQVLVQVLAEVPVLARVPV